MVYLLASCEGSCVVHTHSRVRACVLGCMCRGRKTSLGVNPHLLSTMNVPVSLANRLLETTSACHLSVDLCLQMHTTIPTFTQLLGIQSQILMLVEQTRFYPMSHLLSSKKLF